MILTNPFPPNPQWDSVVSSHRLNRTLSNQPFSFCYGSIGRRMAVLLRLKGTHIGCQLESSKFTHMIDILVLPFTSTTVSNYHRQHPGSARISIK